MLFQLCATSVSTLLSLPAVSPAPRDRYPLAALSSPVCTPNSVPHPLRHPFGNHAHTRLAAGLTLLYATIHSTVVQFVCCSCLLLAASMLPALYPCVPVFLAVASHPYPCRQALSIPAGRVHPVLCVVPSVLCANLRTCPLASILRRPCPPAQRSPPTTMYGRLSY